MARMQVKTVTHIDVANDGMSLTVDLELVSGVTHHLTFPFAQYDWVIQSLMSAGRAAYQQQVATGHMSPVIPIGAAMKAEGMRILPDPAKQQATVQFTGRANPVEPIAIASIEVGATLLPDLAQGLINAHAQLRQGGQS